MRLSDFQEILDKNGIKYYEGGVSLVVKDCPACGSGNFKVLFRVHGVEDVDQPFFGRCQRGSCLQNYSSISYLLKAGAPRNEVMGAHGMDPNESFRKMIPFIGRSILHQPHQRTQFAEVQAIRVFSGYAF